jgi:hypothetical protein
VLRGGAAAALAVPSELHAQGDQPVQHGRVDGPVTTGITHTSHAMPRAASPSNYADPPPPVTDAATRCPAHSAATWPAHCCSSSDPASGGAQLTQEDMRPHLGWCLGQLQRMPLATRRRMR